MPDIKYIIGVVLALLAGVSTYVGLALEKKAVNKIPAENRQEGFIRILLKSRTWLLGIFIHVGLGTVFYILAQYMIGPALVPGIMISGLVVLIIAASKIVGEKFTAKEISGIIMLVVGAVFIAASRLVIDSTKIDLSDSKIIFRVSSFSIFILGLWILSNYMTRQSIHKKALFKGLASGFPYCLSNFWITLFYAALIPLLNHQSTPYLTITLALSAIILVATNILAIAEIQKAFKYGAVSYVIPVQQIPVQMAPIFYFYYVFMQATADKSSIYWILGGVGLIIIGGFMLGKKQEAINAL